jgi:DNA-binding response OmpR family regulator
MSKAPIKMLSIDDRMLTTDLDRAGYRNMGIAVKQVTSFQDAKHALSKETIDIIVINLDYEKIDALAICKHFKSQDETNNIPIVITSVQTSAAVKSASIGAGADLFAEQPIPRQYFIEKLKKLLDQKTRNDDRVGIQEVVTVTVGKENFELPIGDLSTSGMLVTTDVTIADGQAVALSFMLPGYRKPVQIDGRVVRKINVDGNTATAMRGIGIRFEKFHGDSEKRLKSYVSKTADKEGRMIYYL